MLNALMVQNKHGSDVADCDTKVSNILGRNGSFPFGPTRQQCVNLEHILFYTQTFYALNFNFLKKCHLEYFDMRSPWGGGGVVAGLM